MKIIYLSCAFTTCYFIYYKYRSTFDAESDKFRVSFILVPVTGLAFLINYTFEPVEILWTFSIYLEAVAIMPQLQMISDTGNAESFTSHYLFFLGSYRGLYLVNWIWRYYYENFYDNIAIVSGCVQTVLYLDFFYLYQNFFKSNVIIVSRILCFY